VIAEHCIGDNCTAKAIKRFGVLPLKTCRYLAIGSFFNAVYTQQCKILVLSDQIGFLLTLGFFFLKVSKWFYKRHLLETFFYKPFSNLRNFLKKSLSVFKVFIIIKCFFCLYSKNKNKQAFFKMHMHIEHSDKHKSDLKVHGKMKEHLQLKYFRLRMTS